MSFKSCRPPKPAQNLMHAVQRDLAVAGAALGYGKNFHFYTPLPDFRKHEDECIAVLDEPVGNLTGQDGAVFVRYYYSKVRVIPLENNGPPRLFEYLRARHPRLVIADRPFFPPVDKNRARFTRCFDVWKNRTWRDLVPQSALCDH